MNFLGYCKINCSGGCCTCDPDEHKDSWIAWAAGILEGEGCFSIFHRKTAKWDHKQLAIHCEMVDEDIIKRLPEIFGVGTVNLRSQEKLRIDGRNRQDTWIWSVQNHKDICHVIHSISPYLGERRTLKIKEMLEYVESKFNMDHP